MRFSIARASSMDDTKSPCDGARQDDKHPDEWSIEIKNLEALIALSEREGVLVFDTKSITIYDDYME